jgi:beta-lactamase class A
MQNLLESASLRNTHWSVDVRDSASGATVVDFDRHRVLQTASIAKIFLLVEVAAQIASGNVDPLVPVDRRSIARVADSGLWQHFACPVLPVVDLARLVGSLSDNLATNALIDLVGLKAVQDRASRYATDGSTICDVVRDVRGTDDPPSFSVGSAADLALLLVGLRQGTVESPQVSEMVLDWLAAGADLSMVASAFGLDPLAHAAVADRGVSLWNKTGTDSGVRADVGVIHVRNRALAYAVICNWDAFAQVDPRDDVLLAMRRIGEWLLSLGAT